MSLKIPYLCFVIVILFVTIPVCIIAAEKGYVRSDHLSEKQIVIDKSIQIDCYESSKYFVIAKDAQELGTNFLIKYKSKPDEELSCDYTFANKDFEIKNEWAEYFVGLKGDLLILDSTTGPGPSGLIIWDLKKRKKVYEGSWSDQEESGDDSLVFWMETGE